MELLNDSLPGQWLILAAFIAVLVFDVSVPRFE